MFDCLHDMGDPVGAARRVRRLLDDDGTWMIVEPMAGDRIEDNLNPVGRAYYGFSTFLCTPASLSQEVGLALGAQAGRGADRATSSRRAGSAASGARRRPRSTSCSKRGREQRSTARRDTGTRAHEPDAAGVVERNGVRISLGKLRHRRAGVVLLPPWSIVHSRHVEGPVPYLARHDRVVTFDGRGNGLSDRPLECGGVRRGRVRR